MKIITCYLPPSSGTVKLGEYDIAEHPLEIRRRIGYLPEHNPLYLDMYVKEFLDFVARIYQFGAKERKQRIADVIEMTGLGREQHKKLGALSKGYRQRVGLSQALIHDPEVLILDEPTSGLDPNQIVEIRNLIRKVGADKTVIFSSHILSEVEAIADRALIINRGKIVADSGEEGLSALTGDESRIELEVEKPGFHFEEIEKLPGFRRVKNLSPTHFRLYTDKDVDLRKALFQACVSQENALLSLQQETLSLEGAFRKLTSGGSEEVRK
jgi:ABC-2 type transport system ATP-binding protein